MSAVVCGKRVLFDEIHGASPVAKRARCGGGGSPIRLSSPSLHKSNSLDRPLPSPPLHFRSTIYDADDADDQLVGRIFEPSCDEVDPAAKMVDNFHTRSEERDSSPLQISELFSPSNMPPLAEGNSTGGVSIEHQVSETISAADKVQWVELFVREIFNAVDINDAKIRLTIALEALEKTILSRNAVVQGLGKENAALKGHLQAVLRDNHILKRAVAIQHERQVENEESLQEFQQLKLLLSHYQDQIRTLEINNYALSIHLQKAQEGASMPGQFHRDVF